MKKYNSPICEIEALTMADILTASSFNSFSFAESGNLDYDVNIDRIEW